MAPKGPPPKDEQFALITEALLPQINSWEDIFNMFDKRMKEVLANPHPIPMMHTMFLMYGFLTALRELPEEGDIKVLAERMLHIMIYEGEEKLGSNMDVMKAEDLKEFLRDEALKAMALHSATDSGSETKH